jgi:hypothetical protein
MPSVVDFTTVSTVGPHRDKPGSTYASGIDLELHAASGPATRYR